MASGSLAPTVCHAGYLHLVGHEEGVQVARYEAGRGGLPTDDVDDVFAVEGPLWPRKDFRPWSWSPSLYWKTGSRLPYGHTELRSDLALWFRHRAPSSR